MVPNVASMTTAAIDSRTIPLFIAAVRVLVELFYQGTPLPK